MARKLLVAVAAGALALGLLAGPAWAGGAGLLAGAVHADGTFSYQDGGTRTFLADHGRVAAKGDDSIDLLRRDGVTVTVAYDEETCVRVNGAPATMDEVEVGMRAVTVSELRDDGSLLAAAVRAGQPLVQAGQPGCGLLRQAVHGDVAVTYADGSTRDFDWDRGEITEITDGTISVVRFDGVSVTFAYDEDTVHRGHEGIEDLEEGDRITVISEEMDDGSLLAKVIIYIAHDD